MSCSGGRTSAQRRSADEQRDHCREPDWPEGQRGDRRRVACRRGHAGRKIRDDCKSGGAAIDEPQALAHVLEADAGAGALRVFALEDVRDAAGELDHFEPALHVPPDASAATMEDLRQELTARLYGGDQRTRIRQELVLGEETASRRLGPTSDCDLPDGSSSAPMPSPVPST